MANSRQGPADDAAPNYTTIVASWPPEERAARETKLLRKIDLRLLPILILMYIMNYVDRNALPQAKVQGLVADIGLVGVEYNIVLSLTFIGYILMQGMHGPIEKQRGV